MQATVPVILTFIAAALSILHSVATSQAAPINFSQLKVVDDEAALTVVFNRFEWWQTVRVILQAITFVAVLWAVFVLCSA